MKKCLLASMLAISSIFATDKGTINMDKAHKLVKGLEICVKNMQHLQLQLKEAEVTLAKRIDDINKMIELDMSMVEDLSRYLIVSNLVDRISHPDKQELSNSNKGCLEDIIRHKS